MLRRLARLARIRTNMAAGDPEQHGIIGTERVIGQALARWLVPSVVISTESEALAQAEHLGYPVVIR